MSKIIYFSSDYTPHDYRFLSALAETEHEVYYVRLEGGLRQNEDQPVPSKIEQVHWAGGNQPFAWSALPRLMVDFQRLSKKIKPDLVHAGPIQTCAFLTALSGFQPLLTMSWGFDLMQDADRNTWWHYITRYTLKHSTFFTSDCQATLEIAVAFGMEPERTIVFPWGVDLQHFHPRQSAVTGMRQEEGFTLICTRAWEPRYGVDVLARAFVRVAKKRPDVNLLLLGNGSQGSVIRQLFERGGVSERVTFAGQVTHSDLPRFYQMADLYISPSHVDGSSVSLLEALACGLPCLVSNIPANKEWVADGVNGWLFPDGDAEALAFRILALIEDRMVLAGIGQAARRTAEEKADWKKNFLKLIEAYHKTLFFHGSQ